MTELIRAEVQKIALRRLNQIILAVVCALLVLVYVLLWLATDVVSEAAPDTEGIAELRSSLFLEETFGFAIFMLYAFGIIAGAVVAGANVGAEYGWNTIRTLTAAEPRRWRVLLAKVAAVWVMVTLGLLVGLLVALATSAVITLSVGEFDLGFVDGDYVRDSVMDFLRLEIAMAPYLALAVLFGILGRSAVAGIALALGVAFLEGIIGGLMRLAGGWVANLPRYMLDQNGDNLALASGGLGDFMASSPVQAAMEMPSLQHSVIVLLFWAAFFLGAAFFAFHRQDLDFQG